MTTFVLVPGAGGWAGLWHRVVAELQDRGHRGVAVGLPGADPERGLPHYVELVRAAVVAADDDVVLVAQSMGGFTAPTVASLEPVRELVLLNAMIPAPGETAGSWWESTGQLAAFRENEVAQGRDPDAGVDLTTHFLHDVPLEAMAGAGDNDGDEAEIAFTEPWPLAAWPDVPTRVVAASDDRLFPFAFQERVAWQRLGQDVQAVPGGHLAALSRPTEVTDTLLDAPR